MELFIGFHHQIQFISITRNSGYQLLFSKKKIRKTFSGIQNNQQLNKSNEKNNKKVKKELIPETAQN